MWAEFAASRELISYTCTKSQLIRPLIYQLVSDTVQANIHSKLIVQLTVSQYRLAAHHTLLPGHIPCQASTTLVLSLHSAHLACTKYYVKPCIWDNECMVSDSSISPRKDPGQKQEGDSTWRLHVQNMTTTFIVAKLEIFGLNCTTAIFSSFSLFRNILIFYKI